MFVFQVNEKCLKSTFFIQDFIREGCLQKFSRKGYQQRMFFLVRYLKDILLSSAICFIEYFYFY